MLQVRTMIFVGGALLLSLSTMERGALAEAVKTDGDLKITGAVDNTGGDGIIFPDGSTQTKACSACANGVLPTNLGGTGTSVAPATAGQFLRSIGAGIWGIGGIQAGDIPSLSGQYVDLTGAQTVTGLKTFNPSSDSVPFAVNGAKTGMVSNLNSEMVGGNRLSDLDLRYGQHPVAQLPRNQWPETVDSTGSVGMYTSITIGSDGLPIISYHDAINADLKVAHCSDAACTSATITTLDNTGDVGLYTSIAIGYNGLPIISYYDETNGDLKLARCSDIACTSATITTLDSTGVVGKYTSIITGGDDMPIISYYDATNEDLKILHCSNTSCSSSTITTWDSGGNVGMYSSITVGSNTLPVISYYDLTNNSLKVATCNNFSCSNPSNKSVNSAGAGGQYTSVTVGNDGFPIISYYGNTDLKVAHCTDAYCNTADNYTLDYLNTAGRYSSITIGSDGMPIISYNSYYTYGILKVAHCSNISCTSATTYAPHSSSEVGYYTSITIGTDGLPIISYYDLGNGDLRAVKCTNQFCLNGFTRR